MSYCPFVSGQTEKNTELYPCVATCELHTANGCGLKVLIQSQLDISREISKIRKILTSNNSK